MNLILSPLFWRRLSVVLALLLVMLLAVQLVWWSWHFWHHHKTADQAAVVPLAAETIDPALALRLFGGAGATLATADSTSAAPVSDSGIRLKGVYAVDGKTLSAAVVNTGGRDMSVRLNEKIAENITLAEVKPDHIVVLRAGIREKIMLDAASSKQALGSNSKLVAAAPSQFRLNVANTSRHNYSLSRGELNSVLQDPRQVNFLGGISPAPGGGVQISDAPSGTLAQKLGLQPGDIISSINGQPVSSAGDLARFYGQFGSTNSIRAEIKRGGQPLILTYMIQP